MLNTNFKDFDDPFKQYSYLKLQQAIYFFVLAKERKPSLRPVCDIAQAYISHKFFEGSSTIVEQGRGIVEEGAEEVVSILICHYNKH